MICLRLPMSVAIIVSSYPPTLMKANPRKFLTVIICLLFTLVATAQKSIDIFTFSTRQTPSVAYVDTSAESTESAILINIKVPVPLSRKTIWYNNATYNTYQVKSELNNDVALNDIKLQGLILQTGIVQRIDSTRAFQLLFVPRFMNNFHRHGSAAWQFGAIGLFEKRYSSKLRLRYGFMYNQELSGPLLVPLVDVEWSISSKWSISGLFPIYGKINYHVSERFTAGISHFGLITSYALTDPEFSGSYIERTSIDLSLFGRWRLAGNVFIEGRLGYSLDRQYAQYASDDKLDLRLSILEFGDHRRPQKNAVIGNAPFAEFRLSYNLPIDR